MACLFQNDLLLLALVWFCGVTVGQTILDKRCQLEKQVCIVACGQFINVTVVARNVLQKPIFEFLVFLRLRQSTLLTTLEQAAEMVNGFRFKSTYMPVVGYYIDVINGLQSSVENRTFWHLVSSDGGALPCGVSKYIPENGETIIFNFTTYKDVDYIP